MKKNKPLIYRFISLLFLVLFLSPWTYGQKNPKDSFDFPKLKEVKIPVVKNITLKNGLKIMLVEDAQYPTIDMSILVHTGTMYDPADKIGLAQITGEVLRSGGSEKMFGDQIDRELETLAASIESSVETDLGRISVSLLKEDVDKVLPILAQILRNPIFDQGKIDLAKTALKTVISRQNDSIGQITNREFNKLIYGKDHPLARQPEYSTADAIDRKDIVEFYKKYYQPGNMIMAVWGDFKAGQMANKIEKALGNWPKGTLDLPPVPQVNYNYQYTVNYIDKADVNQSNIMIGHIGGLNNNPDLPALRVMNRILSFDRMFKKIRTDEGLAYSVRGDFGSDYLFPGTFSAGAQTKSQSTVFAIKLMIEQIKRIQQEEVSDEELKRAKDQYLNTFVFNFSSKAKIINRMLRYAYYNYPINFDDSLIKNIEKVTKADILKVAQQYLKPDKIQILVVGKKADFDQPLSSLGDVNTIDITIPLPKGQEAPKATPESLEKGKEAFLKAIQAMGNIDKIKNIKSISMKMEMTQVTPMGEMSLKGQIDMCYPDKMHMVLQTPGGEVKLIINGDKASGFFGGNKFPLPEAQRKSTMENILRDPIYITSKLDDYAFQFVGPSQFEGESVLDLIISGPVEAFHFYLDPQTFLPKGSAYQTVGQEGPEKVQEIFSDYQEVDGIKTNFKTTQKGNGKMKSQSVIKELKFNSKLDESLFKIE